MKNDLLQLGGADSQNISRRPPWLRVKIQRHDNVDEVGKMLADLHLNTVCREAHCPNIWECWGIHRTATFMILGDVCTRTCRYCSVKKGRPLAPAPDEPENVGVAVAWLGLRHAVITSVDRDDLADFGAGQYVATIAAIKKHSPHCRIEILTPDFAGNVEALRTVLDARPDVFGHNTETVPRLFSRLRSRGDYRRSLELLHNVDNYRHNSTAAMTTKSGLMLGLGESNDEILAVMDDLRAVNCDVLTLGQYLNPTRRHAAVQRFYSPDEFAELRVMGLAKGFVHVAAGPLVRSSYHAHEHAPPATPCP